MHLGLIGGIGPAATAFYYRRLVQGGTRMDLTISHADIALLLANQRIGAAAAQAEIFAAHIRQLQAAGAEMAALTSVAGHFCHGALIQISALPLVSILATLDQHLQDQALTRVGMIGSQVGMESRLFGAIQSAEIIVPEGPDLVKTGAAYGAMAHRGTATEAEREICLEAGRDLIARGAEAVLLGGTDLFLVFDGVDTGYPVIDAAEVHCARLDELLRS